MPAVHQQKDVTFNAPKLLFFLETTKKTKRNLQVISKLHKNILSYSHFALT